MTVRDIRTKYIDALTNLYSKGEATAITALALEHFGKITKSNIIVQSKNILTTEVENELNTCLQKLLQYEPIQYLIGSTWFYNLLFSVNKQVLIPRPETEELVLEAITFLKSSKGKNVLDIGTGSGCIAISIQKNVPEAVVSALDISEAALTIAKQNALQNKVNITFLCTNFLEEKNYNTLPTYDVIISNPPYIPEDDKINLSKNVTEYEPHIALFVPQHDALIFYKKILLFAENHLAKNGRIFVEIEESLATETATLFTEKNYAVTIKKDMQGKDRMLIIYRCQ